MTAQRTRRVQIRVLIYLILFTLLIIAMVWNVEPMRTGVTVGLFVNALNTFADWDD